MNDKEITEIIATKVRGWHVEDYGAYLIITDGSTIRGIPVVIPFIPPTSDADCMMAWDKVVETRFGIISKDAAKSLINDMIEILFNLRGADRRRAMCECMVKAVSA